MVGKHAARVGMLAFAASVTRVAVAEEPAPPPPAPPAPPPPPAVVHAADAEPDHEQFVGHVGVTYFDIANLPIAPGPGGAGTTVNAPVVGVRYWLHRNLGIDMGLGLGWASGSTTNVNGMGTSMSTDLAAPFGFAVHGGVPIALAHGQHYSFLVIPESTLGFTSETVKMGANVPNTNLSGVLFNLGGRIGAEIHFGFIGVPQLALQGSLGLFFTYQETKSSVSGTSQSSSQSVSSFSTTVGSNPWAIFTNNISATYYL